MRQSLALAARLFKRKAFRGYVVAVLCGLGLYLMFTSIIKSSDVNYHPQPRVLLSPSRKYAVSELAMLQNSLSQLSWERTGVSSDAMRNESRTVLPRILLLYDKQSTMVAKSIATLFQSHRIPHDAHLYNENGPHELTDQSDGTVGRYCLIVCADVASLYGSWSSMHRQHYLNYARLFNVSVVHLAPSGLPLYALEHSPVSPVALPAKQVVG